LQSFPRVIAKRTTDVVTGADWRAQLGEVDTDLALHSHSFALRAIPNFYDYGVGPSMLNSECQ